MGADVDKILYIAVSLKAATSHDYEVSRCQPGKLAALPFRNHKTGKIRCRRDVPDS